ncbi:trypsin-like peptidase domain-containing protein [Peterkaempfera sp. SMS 1(5)a]|uniref:trypsin-like peptidase domain-containing protein n=1 Tax=Peterkaempfera podocarpi TaxID=3232308 RepID=UPI00366FCE18
MSTPAGPGGFDPTRAVQIVAASATGAGLRGSGYLVNGRAVLTAAHVVSAAASVRVRFLDERGHARDLDGEVVFSHPRLDISVVRLVEEPVTDGADSPGAPDGASGTRPVRYGRLGPPTQCEALGFPRFKLRSASRPDGGALEYRDTRHARGTAAPLSALREGVLELLVDPPEYDRDPGHSPWEGMSGAAVWSHGRLVGVVSEHRREDGLGTLTATRVDRWHEHLTPHQAETLQQLIGLPERSQQLDAVTGFSSRFDGYVEAVGRAVRTHPYPGVLPDTAPPPLTGIHARHRPRPLSADATAVPSATSVLSWEELLAGERQCVLLGGPGAGKTSLLRSAAAASISRWQLLREGGSVPVLVDAADLTGELPFPEAVARSVTADLRRFGLLERLPPDFFREPPQPRVPWLVLVDGLDEIASSEARRSVLDLVAHLAKRHPGTYRFVVATRPLPERELEALGPNMPRYELQPFAPDRLRQFAERWFGLLGVPSPEAAAKSFISALERARMAEPARTPLMATMLAQLYAAAPDRPLPDGRSGIYARFVEQLQQRQRTAGPSGIQAQTRATMERYGPAALARAQSTLDALPALIADLAAERWAGRSVPAPDLLAGRPAGQRPEPVPGAVWDEFLRDALRRSGLLVEKAGEFSFLHRTLLEYLAAGHLAAGGSSVRGRELRGQFAEWQRRARMAPFMASVHEQDSFCGFLLDTGAGTRESLRFLRRLVRSGGIEGCEIIARLVQLGTAVPESIVTRAADRLVSRTGRDDFYYRNERIRAAVALSDLRDPRAPDLLAEIAQDSTAVDMMVRVTAAQRALSHLNVLHTVRVINGLGRVQAADRLAGLGDERGVELLLALMRNRLMHDRARTYAAAALVDHGHPHAAEILFLISSDPRIDPVDRVLAAGMLTLKTADRRGAHTLLAMARDTGQDTLTRVYAAYGLGRIGEARGRSLLVSLARRADPPGNPRTDAFARVRAGRALAELGDRRADRVLRTLACDSTLPRRLRRRAAAALAAFERDPGGVTGDRRVLSEVDQINRAYPYLRRLSAWFRLQNRILSPAVLGRRPSFGRSHR